MKQLVDDGFVLQRRDYGEADRIITCLTKTHGVITAIAKGARKSKSKLAGGIEPLALNQFVFMPGRGEMATLLSSRMEKSYPRILSNIEHLSWVYQVNADIIKLAVHDEERDIYFTIMKTILETINQPWVRLEIIKSWYYSRLLQHTGHSVNTDTDQDGSPLAVDKKYSFILEQGMFFSSVNQAKFDSEHIKLLRIIPSLSPSALHRITVPEGMWEDIENLLQNMCRYYLPVVR